ncbi:MAG: alpha/beta hydrolase [Spirochaetaceae bacterium]|jgi:monoterpene epsilon-lactone hydrolase|nr:alpha/beta hydrolase [Spirochaetaceae bacterium]
MASLQSKMIKISLKKMVQKSFLPHLDIKQLRWDDFQKPSPSSRKHCHSDEVLIHGVTCYWMTPKILRSKKIIIYFHGGAYVCGPSLLHWRMAAQISHDAGCRTIMVNYRLAPENSYPSSMDDMMNVYFDVLSYTDAENLIFMGDSAGGGMALATAMKLRDMKMQLPSKLILLSPWLDVTMENPALPYVEDLDHMLAIPGLKEAGKHYCGDESPLTPYISPLFGSLKNLPPTMLIIGTHDLLLCDCRILKEKADEAGFDLYYEEWDEMFHVWMLNVPYLPEAREAVAKIVKYI